MTHNAPRTTPDGGHGPQHIAIVMDGNGRWATKRFLPRLAGHRQGVESLRRCVRACVARGVRVLTLLSDLSVPQQVIPTASAISWASTQ